MRSAIYPFQVWVLFANIAVAHRIVQTSANGTASSAAR
jgi:hypothetical protein